MSKADRLPRLVSQDQIDREARLGFRVKRYLVAALVAVGACSPVHAKEDYFCFDREDLLGQIVGGYGESIESRMLAPDNILFEVWANLKTGTWSITSTNTAGVTCLESSGEDYERLGQGNQV